MTEELDRDTSSASGTPGSRKSAQVTVLEQSLWTQLAGAESLEAFAQAWLALQCGMVRAASRGAVFLGNAARTTIADWPADMPLEPALSEVAALAIAQRRGIVRKLDAPASEAELRVAMAYPLLIDDEAQGAVALVLSLPGDHAIGPTMRQLQWGTAGLRDRLRHERSGQAGSELAKVALDILALVLETERFEAASRVAITELATHCACERVSVGYVERGSTAVAAISHSAEFGKRMNLTQMLGAAMDEAVDQRAVLRYPPDPADEPIVTRAHEQLARSHGAGTILTVPIFVRQSYLGAFTFERRADEPFDSRTVDLLTSVSHLLGPVLDEKRQNDRWLIVKARESARLQAIRLLGPGHLARKLVLLGLIALVVLAYTVTGTYRVTADANIEGRIQRSLIAPFDGFLREAPVRAGETVEEGAMLAALDDRDLALARLKWVTERAQNLHRVDQALSARELSEVNIIRTEISKADAQIALIDEQIARARIVTPFRGIVVAGDLSQQIGAAVRRGDVLFEIAPLNAYRVVLDVAEGQIADVQVGQRGELVTAALPDTPLPLVVTRITPVAEAREGRNTFRVEAELEESSERLRPGMEGIAKIDIDERRLLWIWSRPLVDRVRLWTWRWSPS